MSPHARQRRAAWALLAGVVAVVALIVSVWLVGAKAKSDVQSSEARARQAQVRRDAVARRAQTEALRSGCARSVARDFESLGTNRDLRDFARDAARARAASGQLSIARRYRMRASSAEFRMRRIRLRLPVREDDAAITAYCRTLFPDPASG